MNTTKKVKSLSVIIPAYNESQNLPVLIKQLTSTLKSIPYKKEIIIVDDGSTDDTFSVIKHLASTNKLIKGIKLRQNKGKSYGLMVAKSQTSSQLILTIDADLQDDPQDIPLLINKIEQGYDLVSGWRKTRNDNLSKRISTKLFNFLVLQTTSLNLHDLNCGLKIYNRAVLDTIHLNSGMHRFMPILAQWEGFKITEVSVSNRPRLYGSSKYGINRALKGIIDLITIIFLHKYAQRPLRLFGGIGLVLFTIGFFTGSYLTILRFQDQTIGNRPLLTFTVILIILGFQFFSLGLIGELIANQKKPIINIKETT